MITLPEGICLFNLVKKVYELSTPQGLGALEPVTELTDEQTQNILDKSDSPRLAVDMDYVNGRACKFIVFKNNGKLTIKDYWYDHTDEQFETLLKTFNIQVPNVIDHGAACNCTSCIEGRNAS